ncbi:unnamed protein product [Mytilus edulis]|uniref:Uncharacterized protein n=1 Tax=Mytilus edulis TaxID=6550 RepID=A0A8S3UMP9_MYTED|nr:unnamed protein product [Mytilus edulis]
MSTDLHRSWLSNELHDELTDDLHYILYTNYEIENLSRIRKQQDEVSDAEMILSDIANRNCNTCQHMFALCFINSSIQGLSNIRTYEQLNREAMAFVPECSNVSPPNMKMRFYQINNTLKFIANLNATNKTEFKPLVIELELRIKRTLKMIDSFPETENADIQLHELFYFIPICQWLENCISDLELYNMKKCTKLYANNEHLKIFRKYLTKLLHVLEREIEYCYHI